MRSIIYEYQVSFVQGTKQYAIYVKFNDLTGEIYEIAPLMSKWLGQSYYKFITWLSKRFNEVGMLDLNNIKQRKVGV